MSRAAASGGYPGTQVYSLLSTNASVSHQLGKLSSFNSSIQIPNRPFRGLTGYRERLAPTPILLILHRVLDSRWMNDLSSIVVVISG